jgi:hypothetical protein
MSKFKSFLAAFIYRAKKDLSERLEINLFTILGFMLAQYFFLKWFGIGFIWAFLMPGVLGVFHTLNGIFDKSDSETAHKSLSTSILVFISLFFSAVYIYIIVMWIAGAPRTVMEALLTTLPFGPLILFYVITKPFRRWLGKWGVPVTWIVILILLGSKVYQAWITPTNECEMYKKALKLEEHSFGICKKDSRFRWDLKRETEKRDIAYRCDKLKDGFLLNDSLFERCKKSKTFREALEQEFINTFVNPKLDDNIDP